MEKTKIQKIIWASGSWIPDWIATFFIGYKSWKLWIVYLIFLLLISPFLMDDSLSLLCRSTKNADISNEKQKVVLNYIQLDDWGIHFPGSEERRKLLLAHFPDQGHQSQHSLATKDLPPEGANKKSNDCYSFYIGRVFIVENEKPVIVKSNCWVVTKNGKTIFFLSVERVACRRRITLRCLVTLDGTNWCHSYSSFHLLYLICWWPSCRHRHVESLVLKIKWCTVSTQWMTQVYAQLVGDFKDLQSVAEDQPALDLSVIHLRYVQMKHTMDSGQMTKYCNMNMSFFYFV